MTILALAAWQASELLPLGEDYRWTYHGGTVRRVAGSEKVGDRQGWIVLDPSLPGDLERMVLATGEKGVELLALRRPLPGPVLWLPNEGDSWEARLEVGTAEGDRATLKGKRGPKEKIKVPAGEFEAVRVDIGIEARDGTLLEISMWLAPGTGEVRRSQKLSRKGRTLGEKVFELEAFEKPGKESGAGQRDAGPCTCRQDNPFEECRCLHCEGEAGARCYCGTGGCRCGTKMASCACLHCTGVPGGDDGKGGCDCFGR